VKEWRVKNGEVFDTDSCGELVVNNPVEHRSDDASNSDFKGLDCNRCKIAVLIIPTGGGSTSRSGRSPFASAPLEIAQSRKGCARLCASTVRSDDIVIFLLGGFR